MASNRLPAVLSWLLARPLARLLRRADGSPNTPYNAGAVIVFLKSYGWTDDDVVSRVISCYPHVLAARPEQLQVRAQVLEVRRQPPAARLRAGDAISLRHALPPSRPAGWAGPAPLPVLQPGEQLPAWLVPDAALPGVFKPAAGGRSFGPSLEREREPG